MMPPMVRMPLLDDVMVRATAPIATAPVPRFSAFVPRHEKLPIVMGLFAVSVRAPPDVLSRVPPLTMNVPATVPSAEVLLMCSLPLLMVTPAVRPVFVPERTTPPAPVEVVVPAMVRREAPLTAPDRTMGFVSLFAVTTMPVCEMAPDSVSFCVPVKANEPVIETAFASERSAPMASRVPPASVRVPVPTGPFVTAPVVLLLMFSVPADRVTPPEKKLAPPRVSAAVPALLMEPVEAPKSLLSASVPPLTVMVFAPVVMVAGPVPKSRELLPA